MSSAAAPATSAMPELDVPISRDGELSVPKRGLETWYLLAYSKELKPGATMARSMHGRELVLYRGKDSGRVFALAAHCSHMGTHLKHGDVLGDEIRCPLHHWRFDGDGTCTEATACDEVPKWARQRSFPVQERHGAIFVYNGSTPRFDVPSWDGLDTSDMLIGHVKSLTIPCHWVPVATNAWDGVHLFAVHQRAARTPPEVTHPTPTSCRMGWHADVAGAHFADVVTRKVAGTHGVRAHITNHGGMVLLIESRVGKGDKANRLLLGLDPQPDDTVVVRALFPVARSWVPGLAQLKMRIQRRLFRRFLAPDVEILGDIRYRPRTPLDEGEPLQGILEFLDAQPGAR